MAVGIVAEFNPFHNGHKYLLETAKKITDDSIVVIMSGSFVQRGGIAITDKATRTKLALENGADLVLELPVTFSHNTAQKFASCAVGTLFATGVVDKLAFGSESGTSDALLSAAKILSDEPKEVSEKIKTYLSEGMSYPSARQRAYDGIIPSSLMSAPNDILALEYLKACCELGFDISPVAIKRTGADHDSKTVSDNIASASEIRNRLINNTNVDAFMPNTEFDIYNPDILDTAVLSRLRLMSPSELSDINDVTEGLENRFSEAAKASSTVEELITAVKSKRYPLTRLRRIAYSALLGLRKDICAMPVSYIRVLGMNDNGKSLLKQMKDTAKLPVITKPADYTGDTIFDINAKADDIFALCAPTNDKKRGGIDLRYTPVIL